MSQNVSDNKPTPPSLVREGDSSPDKGRMGGVLNPCSRKICAEKEFGF